MKILIIGPQGSGKSTQAKILAEKLNIPFIGTGEMLRNMAKEDNDLGRQINEILDQGNMVEDNVMCELVRVRLSEEDCAGGFILDGYPRTLVQQQIFDPEFDEIFYLTLPIEVAKQRLLGRGREDDTEELIERRLNDYYTQTKPLLDFYQKLGKLVVINGEKPIEEVAKDIENHLIKKDKNGQV